MTITLMLTPQMRLDHLRQAESACMDAIREAINVLAEQIGLKNQDRRWLLDDIADVLQGATADIKSEFGA